MSGRLLGLVWGLVSLAALGCNKSPSGENAVPAMSAVATANAAAVVDVAAAKAARPSRQKLTCAELVPRMEEMAKSLKMPVKTTPGSWGKVPKQLQVLPPGGALCGSVDMMDQAVLTTGLAGEELESFYAPLFAKADCAPLKCEDVTSGSMVQTRCTCHGEGFMGSVTTDTGAESVTLGVLEARFYHKGK
jgi:hypothetical protein